MSEHHPMFGCRNASSLLCCLGLPKSNKIKVFWVFSLFCQSPTTGKNPVVTPENASPEPQL
jgi:hypothetical protein